MVDRNVEVGLVVKRSKMGRVRRALLMPFPCKWNAWVRDYTAECERLWFHLRGGERTLYRRLGIDQ